MIDQLAITYHAVTVTEMTGGAIKTLLEDVADNRFNPDLYYQQGGDMVRAGGLGYRCAPLAAMGARISELRLKGKPLEADKRYKVAGWASVAEGVRGEPIWDVVETWLRDRKVVAPRVPSRPTLLGVQGNPGIDAGAQP